MTEQQSQTLRFIAQAVIDAVKAAAPSAAPSGILYARLMTQGCTLHQFQQIMAGLTRAGYLAHDETTDTYTTTGKEPAP